MTQQNRNYLTEDDSFQIDIFHKDVFFHTKERSTLYPFKMVYFQTKFNKTIFETFPILLKMETKFKYFFMVRYSIH